MIEPRRYTRWPAHLERQLAARLRRRARVVRTVVLEQLHALPRHDSARADGWLGDQVRALGGRIKHALGIAQPIPASSLGQTAKAIDTTVTAAVVRDLEAQIPGAVLSPIVAAGTSATREAIWLWTREAAIRISELEAGLVDRAVEAAAVAVDQGADPQKAARDALDSAETRAALLARDATGDLVSEVTRIRSGELGSDQYVWRTQHDNRVRPLHQELDGTSRRWDDPHPTEGHPGDAFGCRCWAEPIANALATRVLPPSPGPAATGGRLQGAGAGGKPPTPPPPPAQLSHQPPAPTPAGLVEGRKRAPPTPPPDPFAGPHLPDGLPAPPLDPSLEVRRQAIRAVETEIRSLPEEHCGTQLSDGTILRSGPEYSRDHGIKDTTVALLVPDDQLRRIQDDGAAIFTHNHPGTGTFSPKDLKFAADVDLLEMRATHRDGGAWLVRRPESGWPDPQTIQRELTEAAIEAEKRAMVRMDEFILAHGGDPRDQRSAKGWSDAVADRIGDDEYNAGIRDALATRGITLEFDP